MTTTEDTTKNTEVKENAAGTEAVSSNAKETSENAAPKRGPRGGKPFQKNERPRRPRKGAGKRTERREFDQKIISIRRVTRVVAGGRRFNFSVAMVIGDRKGRVGVGLGKAGDTALAIEKAIRNAKKNMITIRRTKENSIRHDVAAKYCAAQVHIIPTKERGIVAGSSVRNVLELSGVVGVTAKIGSRSKNQLNNARAAIIALESLKG